MCIRDRSWRDNVRQFIIQGGIPLKGEVEISGAKNAAAAILAAAMLCDGVCVIDNLPYISDVVVMAELIEYMGAKVELSPDVYKRQSGFGKIPGLFFYQPYQQ